MEGRALVRREIEPSDILTAAGTIPVNDVYMCNWLQDEWVAPETYLAWAKEGLQQPEDAHSLSNAICYAKRTVCRLIDALILGNHLRCFAARNYRVKTEKLGELCISIAPIVHELVLDPRNQLEHEYKRPERASAQHAVQVAELFLQAMQHELQRKPIVALAWNVLAAHLVSMKSDKFREGVNFHGFSTHPMLFVDIFTQPVEVKIVHPEDEEVCFARLEAFTEKQCLQLARKLREHYTQGLKSTQESCMTSFFYKEVKRQAGF